MTHIGNDSPQKRKVMNKIKGGLSAIIRIKMTTATITANEIQLKLLLTFCSQNGIGIDIKESSSNVKADTRFLVPNPKLKYLCGPEMMTSKGKMQPSAAAEYIMMYAKRNDLLQSTFICMDNNLSDVFDRYDSIRCTELPALVNAMFSE